jgi:hypothetical protein
MNFNWKQFFKRIYLIREGIRCYRSIFGQPKWGNKITQPYSEKVKSGSENKILIATGGGSYLSGVSIESMLGAALNLRGFEAHVLLCDEVLPACFQSDIDWDRNERKFASQGPSSIFCKACFKPSSKMYELLGFTVHRISDFVSEQDRIDIKNIVQELTYDQIRHFKYDEIPVGEHAYAGALRFYAKAELSDPYSEQILRRYLEASIISTIAIKNLCNKISFYRAVLHHGIYVPQGVFAESLIKLKIPIVTWHVAYRKETFMFSHKGTYHRTLMTEPVNSWEDIPWSDKRNNETLEYLNSRWFGSKDWIHFHRNTVFDKNILYNELCIIKGKPYVLLLTNVMWDAQLHYPNNAFSSMLEWIKYSINWFIKNPELQLVIRVHPAEVTGTLPSRQLVLEEIKKEFGPLPKNIILIGPENTISTYVLAEECNAAIIYGTKTGVELAAKGIPVIVAGEAWIRNKGVSIDVNTPLQYESVLNSLPFKERMRESEVTRARKYAFHFFFRRMIPLSFIKAKKNSIAPFEFDFKDISELGPGKNRGLDIICDGIINGAPFVYDPE